MRSEPALLYYRGRFLHAVMRGERVTESEVYQAIRADGYAGLDQVEAVVLESDGSFSVVTKVEGSDTALSVVPGWSAKVPAETDGSVS